MLHIRYFSSIREMVGVSDERIEPPAGVTTVAELLDWLSQRGEIWARALKGGNRVLTAVDEEVVPATTLLVNANEVAIFPPVSGG